MKRFCLLLFYPLFSGTGPAAAQVGPGTIDSFRVGDVRVTIDRPMVIQKRKKTIICFYALPNGNTTAQTMGKRMQPGDDWHFDIQHIRAQTRFIRQTLRNKNFIVVYMENDLKSWPSWKQKHPEFRERIPVLVDSICRLTGGRQARIYLNGHSGGGSFIFGYLAGLKAIPPRVKRISFLDSNYGYDSSYYPLLREWLRSVRHSALNVFAYNDSVALYNGKPVVSAKGGTWYRSRLMLQNFSAVMPFERSTAGGIERISSADKRVWFFFKPNPDKAIYHTQQVELNGFIHSVLCGTKYDSKGYMYFGKRAYSGLIE